jgi:hypothetical protein
VSNKEVFKESFNLLCGAELGSGMSRTVFECAILPGYVVKVESDPHHHYQNIMEWRTWCFVQHTAASRWFAECRWISPNGKILIQERTYPARPSNFPRKVPAWFTDLKRANWGLAQSKKKGGKPGRDWLVCHDYGTSLALQEGTTTKRLKKADWYDE